jgi:hypothetical protein
MRCQFLDALSENSPTKLKREKPSDGRKTALSVTRLGNMGIWVGVPKKIFEFQADLKCVMARIFS